MTMYLPNPSLQPTGFEPAEYVDLPPMSEPIARRGGTSVALDSQTRLNIARWAEEYITGLVENHNGAPEDVRSIIHSLHDRRAIAGRVGSW